MSSFLISQLENLSKENLNIILDITNEKTLNDFSKFVLSQNNKDAVLFLIENNKISKSLSLDLFKFIVNNKYWDMFLNLDYIKFDIHADDDYALRRSSDNGHIIIVKFLVENGANIHADNDYALRRSSENGHIIIVKFLVENGTNIHADNDYALRWSSRNGHIEVVQFLIDKGANIHANNDYALIWSSYNGHIGVVQFLIEKGANIHAENDEALKSSGYHGQIEVVKFLIENGANIHTGGDCVLILSSDNRHIEVVKFLLNSDLEYFSKNQKAINVVKKHKLIEFYKKFGIIEEVPSQKIPQLKNDIMKYINSNDLESLKICNEFDFSMDEYYYFFKSLVQNKIEINQIIFGFIKDKEDLRREFNNILPCFDNEKKDKFQKLFKNEKINELKKELEKLKEEFIKLQSQ
jgi:ankyrin repeat protein